MNRVSLSLLWLALGSLPATGASAHEHWIEVSDFFPVRGSKVDFFVCGGHYFPESSGAPAEEVISSCCVHNPDGSIEKLRTTLGDKKRGGRFFPDSAGVYILEVILKRPQAEDPAFELRAILIGEKKEDHPRRYLGGKGLELVPETALSTLVPGTFLSLSLYLDGEAVEGAVSVLWDNGKSRSARTAPGKPAAIDIPRAGSYLATASVRGRSCSLVFQVTDPDRKNPIESGRDKGEESEK
ncbi:MAG: DUF4198 domain-containing protein [Candidatus Krumholzibacteriota bacterium]|nr:DUF4198 domain-containing protein [Candidatus Krumholzibacteriota bacterium]